MGTATAITSLLEESKCNNSKVFLLTMTYKMANIFFLCSIYLSHFSLSAASEAISRPVFFSAGLHGFIDQLSGMMVFLFLEDLEGI